MTEEERRREARHSFEARGWLSWRDAAGERRQSRGYCLNVSETGLRIEIPEPVDVGVDVRVGIPGVEPKPATVIYCKRIGPRYAVGLEFTETQAREVAS